MHPMFKPENFYSFADSALNQERVSAFCQQIEDCRNPDDLNLAGQKAHWMLCAFWHGARDQFANAQDQICAALYRAEQRM